MMVSVGSSGFNIECNHTKGKIMAKICGYITDKQHPDKAKELLHSMVTTMKHEPELQENCLPFEGGGLAILESPIINKTGLCMNRDHTGFLALSGHIVDIASIKDQIKFKDHRIPEDSDCIVLLAALESFGVDILPKLNGVFSFVYYDSIQRKLIVGNDRYGFHPFYYLYDKNILYFASEVKAILQIADEDRTDWEAWADFFYIGHMMGQKTLVKNIKNLDAGQWLLYQEGQLTKKKYYDFTKMETLDPEEISTEKVASLFTQAVERRIDHNLPNSVLLSGGFDSRLTLSALVDLGIKPRVVALQHADEYKGLDGAIALRFAKSLGLTCDFRPTRNKFYYSDAWNKTFFILDGMIPNLDLFIAQVYLELTSDMGVVWDGLALDSILGGYHNYRYGSDNRKNLDNFAARRYRQIDILKYILQPDVFNSLNDTFDERLKQEFEKVPNSANRFILFRIQNLTRRRISVNPYQLYDTKVIPTTPALDTDFLEYTLSIPKYVKLNHKLYFEVLKNHFPKLLEIPVCSGGSIYFGIKNPSLILQHYDWRHLKKWAVKLPGMYRLSQQLQTIRQKTCFSDSDYQIIHLLDEAGFERDFLKSGELKKRFKQYKEGNIRHRELFTSVFYLELWHRLFVDKITV